MLSEFGPLPVTVMIACVCGSEETEFGKYRLFVAAPRVKPSQVAIAA